jgi:hypothetical protein
LRHQTVPVGSEGLTMRSARTGTRTRLLQPLQPLPEEASTLSIRGLRSWLRSGAEELGGQAITAKSAASADQLRQRGVEISRIGLGGGRGEAIDHTATLIPSTSRKREIEGGRSSLVRCGSEGQKGRRSSRGVGTVGARRGPRATARDESSKRTRTLEGWSAQRTRAVELLNA